MEKQPEQHEPKVGLKDLFRHFANIIMFCIREMEKEEKEKKMKEKL